MIPEFLDEIQIRADNQPDTRTLTDFALRLELQLARADRKKLLEYVDELNTNLEELEDTISRQTEKILNLEQILNVKVEDLDPDDGEELPF